MKKFDLFILVYCIIVVLSVMYATQPLQPLLAKEFNVSMTKASHFTAVIMLFLALSPIIYGYILEKVNAKKMLINSSLVLFVTNIFLGLSTTYELFIFFRTIEALVVPAILTSLMSILANIDKENIKFNIMILTHSGSADRKFEEDIGFGIWILTQNNGLGGANRVCLELGGRCLMTQNSKRILGLRE